MKLKFGRGGSSEPPSIGRMVTSLEAPAAPAAPPAPAVDLDALATRVLERLGQSPLPEPLARIVAEVSERLVREEIARIRAKASDQ